MLHQESPPPWTPSSWTSCASLQLPSYADQADVTPTLLQISELPPLVSTAEISHLTGRLVSLACSSRGFILQGGDCAEMFADCRAHAIDAKVALLKELSDIVRPAAGHVIIIGRIAGQYSKPRSSDMEITSNGSQLQSYRGDAINGFSSKDRATDPSRMLSAYWHAAATLNYMRMRGCIVSADEVCNMCHVQGSHLLWLGMRTRAVDGAHCEYMRGISNPIAIKLDSTLDARDLVQLLLRLRPASSQSHPAPIVCICRYGCDNVRKCLPGHIQAVQRAGIRVIWMVDPMHGNTVHCVRRGKTRRLLDIIRCQLCSPLAILPLCYTCESFRFERLSRDEPQVMSATVCSEIQESFAVHTELGSRLAGVHLEMTYERVNECDDEDATFGNAQLERCDVVYTSSCDPRLNREQAIRVAKVCKDGIQKAAAAEAETATATNLTSPNSHL